METHGDGPRSEVLFVDEGGRKQLEAEVVNWERLTEAVALILRTAEEELKSCAGTDAFSEEGSLKDSSMRSCVFTWNSKPPTTWPPA
jgi:hypothetical protein